MDETEQACDEFLNNYTVEQGNKCRQECARCMRPTSVCLCNYLPPQPIQTSIKIHILQHPREQKRRLTTVPILCAALAKDCVRVYRGIRFTKNRLTELTEIASSPSTVILYPSSKDQPLNDRVDCFQSNLPRVNVPDNNKICLIIAIDIKQLSDNVSEVRNLFVIDGTWQQARTIIHRNEFLKKCVQVKLMNDEISKFVIRTQPTVTCLSTIEAVALSLEILENNSIIKEALLKPLSAMCDMQLACGAVVHASKDIKKKMQVNSSAITNNETGNESDE